MSCYVHLLGTIVAHKTSGSSDSEVFCVLGPTVASPVNLAQR